MTARGLCRTNTALSAVQITRKDTKRYCKLISLTRKFSQQRFKKHRVLATSLRHGLPSSHCCHVYASQQNMNFQHFYSFYYCRLQTASYKHGVKFYRRPIGYSTNLFTQQEILETIYDTDVWLTVHRSSMWSKKPTRCHLVLYLFLLYKLLNKYRVTLCPSSGADNLVATSGKNTTKSSAPEDGHKVARNMLSNL